MTDTEQPCDPARTLLGRGPREVETYVRKETCTRRFIAALLATAIQRKPPSCLATDSPTNPTHAALSALRPGLAFRASTFLSQCSVLTRILRRPFSQTSPCLISLRIQSGSSSSRSRLTTPTCPQQEPHQGGLARTCSPLIFPLSNFCPLSPPCTPVTHPRFLVFRAEPCLCLWQPHCGGICTYSHVLSKGCPLCSSNRKILFFTPPTVNAQWTYTQRNVTVG